MKALILFGLSETARKQLEDLWHQTNEGIRGVGRLSQDLRPAALDRLGLLPALNWLTADIGSFSGIKSQVTVHGTERRLPGEAEQLLFRIAQEALHNAIKHASAENIAVRLEKNSSQALRLEISDYGQGLADNFDMGLLSTKGHYG